MEYQEVPEGNNETLDQALAELKKVFSGSVRWQVFDDNGEMVIGLIDFNTGEVLIIGRQEEK